MIKRVFGHALSVNSNIEGENMLYGTAASEGIGIGKALIIEEHSLEYENTTVTDTDAEIKRFQNAVEDFATILLRRRKLSESLQGIKRRKFLKGIYR